MEVAQSPRMKTVDHYQLKNLITSSSLCEFWTAKHKLLNKSFVLKKIKITQSKFPESYKESPESLAYELAKKEANLLNELKKEAVPRCHKLIRTTASVYVVYDSFPGSPLQDYLTEQRPTPHDTIKLMVALTTKLARIHQLGYVMVRLAPQHIYVTDPATILFTDWTLTRNVKTTQPFEHQILKNLDKVPKYLQKSGSPSYASDIYNLGMVFSEMLIVAVEWLSSYAVSKIKDLLSKMTPLKEAQTVDLSLVLKTLQKIKNTTVPVQPMSPTTPTFNFKSKLVRSNDIQERIGKIKLQKIKSGGPLNSVQEKLTKSVSKIEANSKEQSASNSDIRTTAHTRRLSTRSISKEDCQELEFIGRTILKRRSLAFFLLNLSEFIQEQRPQIAYMLLKKSRACLCSAQTECNKLSETDTTFQIISPLLISQLAQVQSLLQKCQRYLFDNNLVSESKRQFTNILSVVNLNYLHQNIKQYASSILEKGITRGLSFEDTNQHYYHVYMLLKSLQCGSYELFWDKTFRRSNPVSNYEYFAAQKKLGLRYFKSKIQSIIAKHV